MNKVKVTVVKTCNFNDLFPGKPPLKYTEYYHMGPQCPIFKEGQEIIIGSDEAVPEGFCAWAYADLQRDITHLMYGGNCNWVDPPGANLACCTDGFRPVIFKIERMEDGN